MFTARYRRKRYPRLLIRYPLDTGGGSDTIYHLVAIWSKVRWGDYANLPVDKRVGTLVSVGTPNLPKMLTQLKSHNQLIKQQRDSTLERLNANPPVVQDLTLDMFFADDNQLEIDVEFYLNKICAQLHILHTHIRAEEGAYYSRMSGYLYRDLTSVTTALLSVEA